VPRRPGIVECSFPVFQSSVRWCATISMFAMSGTRETTMTTFYVRCNGF
jgi:hypothetical protein